jgi:hypothetical protein
MATHDYVIANGTGAAVRSDLNNALAAIVSNNSGSSEPGTTYAYQWWADTNANVLKIRNSANNAWITLRELDGTMLIEDGSASGPGLSFLSDTNTGFFSGGADKLGFTAGGVERLEIGSSEVVFNDPSNDVDFRVESNGQTHMLFVDGGNDSIGVGISNPGDYHASANAIVSSGGITLANTTMGSIFFADSATGTGEYVGQLNYEHSTNSMQFITNNSERIRIDSSGRVGIANNTPGSFDGGADDLVVGSGSGDSGITVYSGTSNLSNLYFADGTSGTAQYMGGMNYNHSNNALAFFTNGGNTRMSIDSSGNVGIGTTSMGAPLSFADSSALKIQFNGDVANFYGISKLAGGGSLGDGEFKFTSGNTGAGGFTFSSGGTERLRIGNNGHQYADCRDTSLASLTLRKGVSGADSIDYMQCRSSSNSALMVVKGDGDLENANNSYGSISDVKLKENIVDASSQWDDIKAIRVRNYNYKEETGLNTHRQLGVIAQEIETVSSGLVSESPDRDDDGSNLGTVTKSVKYSVLYMKAVKALQEAMDRIETLEAKVAALEAG